MTMPDGFGRDRATVLTVAGYALTVDWSKVTGVQFETPADVRVVDSSDGWVHRELTGRHRLVLTAEFDGNPFEWVTAE
jgi:glycine/D-amino acid oxidase-like deaminating enzyme